MKKDSNKKQSFLGIVSLKDEKLSQRISLTFGFMAFIPVLILALAFISVVFPYLPDQEKELLKVYLVGAILSIIVGYIVLKHTVAGIMRLVEHARKVAQKQLGENTKESETNEIGELAKTFNRITLELEKKIEQLEESQRQVKELLARIGSAMNAADGIDHLFKLILEHSAIALNADAATIMLLDPETQLLSLKSFWTLEGSNLREASKGLESSLAGWVARKGQPMRGRDLASAIGLQTPDGKQGAVVSLPMQIQGKTTGALSIFNARIESFSDDDEILLGNIASQLAIAAENNRLNTDVEQTYVDTITALALAVEAKDPYSAGHSKRVGYYAEQIGRSMGLDEETANLLREGGILHDVGKIGIKDEILLKPAPLNAEETAIMHQHPIIGEAILKPLRSMKRVAEMVRHHHERYDGGGYPDQLKGEDIPLTARILLIADALDSMVTDRPYRRRLSDEVAKEELRKGAGVHFDPKVVDAALRMLEQKKAQGDLPCSGKSCES